MKQKSKRKRVNVSLREQLQGRDRRIEAQQQEIAGHKRLVDSIERRILVMRLDVERTDDRVRRLRGAACAYRDATRERDRAHSAWENSGRVLEQTLVDTVPQLGTDEMRETVVSPRRV